MPDLSSILKWVGSKWRLAKSIAPLIPVTERYVELYGGSAAILASIVPRKFEVYNDLDPELSNFFTVLKDKQGFESFQRRIQATLYHIDEFKEALNTSTKTHGAVDAAWAFFVRQNQGFGGRAFNVGSWGRSLTAAMGMAYTTAQWNQFISRLPEWHARFQNVVVRNGSSLDLIPEFDGPETCFYADPPYVNETRAGCKDYNCDQDDDHHHVLIKTLCEINGSAVVSGYNNPIYTPLVDHGFIRVDQSLLCLSAGRQRGAKTRGKGGMLANASRVESIWVRDVTGRAVNRIPGLGS